MASDLYHYWGDDLALSPTGGLLLVADEEAGTQRVLRRLLTNEGDYLWHPNYGAGLPKWVGRTFNEGRLDAIIQSQIMLENAVARSPAPKITVQAMPNGAFANIKYVDSTTGQTVTTPVFEVTA